MKVSNCNGLTASKLNCDSLTAPKAKLRKVDSMIALSCDRNWLMYFEGEGCAIFATMNLNIGRNNNQILISFKCFIRKGYSLQLGLSICHHVCMSESQFTYYCIVCRSKKQKTPKKAGMSQKLLSLQNGFQNALFQES